MDDSNTDLPYNAVSVARSPVSSWSYQTTPLICDQSELGGCEDQPGGCEQSQLKYCVLLHRPINNSKQYGIHWCRLVVAAYKPLSSLSLYSYLPFFNRPQYQKLHAQKDENLTFSTSQTGAKHMDNIVQWQNMHVSNRECHKPVGAKFENNVQNDGDDCLWLIRISRAPHVVSTVAARLLGRAADTLCITCGTCLNSARQSKNISSEIALFNFHVVYVYVIDPTFSSLR